MMSSIILMPHDLSQPIRIDAPYTEGPYYVRVWTLKMFFGIRIYNVIITTINVMVLASTDYRLQLYKTLNNL